MALGTVIFTTIIMTVMANQPYLPPKSNYPPTYYSTKAHNRPPYSNQNSQYGSSYADIPACAKYGNKTWCLQDSEYPLKDIQYAIKEYQKGFLDLYSDVAGLNTENSVDSLRHLKEEASLCPSQVEYIQPLRAVDVNGAWKIIVNQVKVDYEEFTQSARAEICRYHSQPCPLVPQCYESKCVQKSIYHRFLVYDPYDKYFPFSIQNFLLPSSCSCHVSQFALKY